MSSSTTFVAHYEDFSAAQRSAVVRLKSLLFSKEKTFEELLRNFEAHLMAPAEDRRFFLTVQDKSRWEADGSTLVAHAELFPRAFIETETKSPVPIWALAGVCTHPELQGNGYGRQTVLKALDFAASRGRVCAFQTDVPEFYAKLGCRLLNNPFCNSAEVSEERRRMWWCKAVMIHPAEADWPEGELDLNGSAF